MTRNGLARVLSIALSLVAIAVVPSSLAGCAHTVEDPDGGDPNADDSLGDDGGDDGGFEVPDAHHAKDSGHKGDASPTDQDAAGDDGAVDDPDAIVTFDQPGSTGRIPELPQEGEAP